MKSYGAGPLRMVDMKDVVDPIAFPSPVMGMHGSGDWFLPVSTDRLAPPRVTVRVISKLVPCKDEWWASVPEDEKQSAAARLAVDYGLDQHSQDMTEATKRARTLYLDGMLEHKYRAIVIDRGDGRCKWLRLTGDVQQTFLEREEMYYPSGLRYDWCLRRCFGHLNFPQGVSNEVPWYQTMWLLTPSGSDESQRPTVDQTNEAIRLWGDHLKGLRTCYHDWVNVSLFFKREVCKHCDAER